MNIPIAGGLAMVFAVGSYALFADGLSSSNTSEGYERSDTYAQCDIDYLQSARHLGFSASASECECFDDRLQQLSPTARRAAYKSLEDRLTLAFMGKAGAKVKGSQVEYNDRALGRVSANLNIETSGKAIMQECEMF